MDLIDPATPPASPLTGLTIVITGGASGFLGSAIARSLAANNQVLTVGRRPGPPGHIVDDIVHPDRSRYPARCDAVVHMSALLDDPVPGHVDPSPRSLFDVNIAGTMSCLNLAEALGAKTFVLGSSGGVYGFSAEPVAESAALEPVNFYGHSKVASEFVLRGVRERFESTLVARYFMPLGPHGTNPLWRHLVATLHNGDPVAEPEAGRGRINPIHIDDAVELTVMATAIPGHHTFNVAGAETVDRRSLINELALALGVTPRWSGHTDPGPGCVGDISAIRQATGYTPRHDLAAMVRASLVADHS